MKLRTQIAVGLLGTALAVPAAAAPSGMNGGAQPVAVSTASANRRAPQASVTLKVGLTKAWVGHAVPITLTAYFKHVDSVTLQASPRIESKGIITSQLSEHPSQSTQMIKGEPTLVAQWKGSITPSAPGPIELSVTLNARLEYRPVVRGAAPIEPNEDFFSGFGFGADPFDTGSIFQHMRQQMRQMDQLMVESSGPVRAQDVELKATALPVEAQALPVEGQPVDFRGAVGRFELKASVASDQGKIDEPLTLRVTVEGSGDLDRVELAGVAGSDEWKAYPPKAIAEPTDTKQKKPERKVFEQVLVPIRGGELSIPAVSLSAFDPKSGSYLTRQTRPLTIHVDGTRAAAPSPAPTDMSAGNLAAQALPVKENTDAADVHAATTTVTHATAPILAWVKAAVRRAASVLSNPRVLEGAGGIALLFLAGWAVERLLRRGRRERSLQRQMRRAAARGKVDAFYAAGRRLVEVHLAKVWGLGAEQVTVREVRARLGHEGEPLVQLLAEDEALRFGRGTKQADGLKQMCASVEGALNRAA